jgi:CDP-glucose 4,6-dehydratase
MSGQVDPAFWRGRRVLLTGHTGFKGAWCALWLASMGARVTGFALPPDTDPNLYEGAQVAADVDNSVGDLKDRDAVRHVVARAAPEIVLHMAAQALVRPAFCQPVETVATNVLGTVHLLDALREAPSAHVVLVITSDKVYENVEDGTPFREHDRLGGREMYGASKAAAEILTAAMARSHFTGGRAVIATARGGNVIGGGDYAPGRLVPDIVRAVARGEPVLLRHPEAVRPWQHVLDCLSGYLIYVQVLAANPKLPRMLNVGPLPETALTVRQLADAMLQALSSDRGWKRDTASNPYEAQTLALDTALIRTCLGWRERLPGTTAIEATAAWYLMVARGQSMRDRTLAEIEQFMKCV